MACPAAAGAGSCRNWWSGARPCSEPEHYHYPASRRHEPQQLFSPGCLQESALDLRILWGLVVLFLIMDGVMHVMQPAPVVQAMNQLGFPLGSHSPSGSSSSSAPRSMSFRALRSWALSFLPGTLEGAVAAHLRVGNPRLSHTFFPLLSCPGLGWIFARVKVLRPLGAFR